MKSNGYINMALTAIIPVATMVMLYSCKKPYNPGPIKSNVQILVVDGVIDASLDNTVIRLSRTIPSDSTGTKGVTGASVIVESDNGNSYQLSGGYQGYYYYPGLNLDITRKYRLHIKTTDIEDEYLSEYVPVRISPPIDSVGYTITATGLQLYVNAHDATNSTRYYRYDYDETWAFHSLYYSYYIAEGNGLVARQPNQQIYYCFNDDHSSDIVLASSAKLSQDVIYQNPVAFIPANSEKLETKYSILLHQYALTSDAFNFWQSLRTNTEELGTIFDPQPSNITGNIYSIYKGSEPVIGYVSACLATSKRIFISKNQLPQSWQPTYPYQCQQDTFLISDKNGMDQTRAFIGIPPSVLPTSAVQSNGITIGYLGADAGCVDCTLRGYTSQPSFWQ